MSNDKKEVTAKELIPKIEVAESVEEVEVLAAEGTEFSTVEKAAEKRIAELTADSEETPEPESEEEETEDQEQPEAEEKVEVIVIGKKDFEEVQQAVEAVLEFEKTLRGVNNVPKETEGKLGEAAEVFKFSPKEVPATAWANLEKAIQQHLQYDQQRRGMSTKLKQIAKLEKVYEKLTAEEETEE